MLPHLLHVGEDRVGLLSLLQGFAFLNSFESVVHPIEDVADRALAGQFRFGVALLDY